MQARRGADVGKKKELKARRGGPFTGMEVWMGIPPLSAPTRTDEACGPAKYAVTVAEKALDQTKQEGTQALELIASTDPKRGQLVNVYA